MLRRNVIMRDCTKRLADVVKQAYAFAKERGDLWMGTEHLLVGMLREGHSAAALILEARGLDLEEVEVIHRATHLSG